jgi:predicted  nucleic acid-binding Zn-ribbon protein
MNTAAKILPLAPANAEEELTRLRRRVGELGTRRDALTRLIIEAEKTVGAGGDHFNSDLEQAAALLDGKKFIPSREKSFSPVEALKAERNAVDAALKLGRARLDQLTTERAGAIWASYQSEISQIEMRRVTLALQLQRTNHEREQLREKIVARGGAGCFHTDGVDLLGLTERNDDIQWAAARLIADGVCTRREMEKASSNG